MKCLDIAKLSIINDEAIKLIERVPVTPKEQKAMNTFSVRNRNVQT